MHSSYIQLGRLHITIFGIFAAIGLMTALALSQRTARYAALAPEVVWNAGMTAIVSAFVISRLLLIAFNLRSFLQYPLLILTLPSLTTTGILLTALFMLGYTRWRKLPLLPLLNSAAPCAALLWAFLSLGRYFDGTRDGMPTHWPTQKPAIQPVELYTFVLAALVCLASLRTIKLGRVAGQTAAIALTSSGLGMFFIDFFRLPSDLVPNLWLDPAQIIGIAMILVGAALLIGVRTQIERESGNEPPHAI